MADNAFLEDVDTFGTPERELRETIRKPKPAVAGSGIDKLKEIMKDWYTSGDIGIGPEASPIAGAVSMARPASRVWPKIEQIFGKFVEDYPRVKLQRFQNEPAGKETFRRGGEYYLGLDPDTLKHNMYRTTIERNTEGGELLKLRQLELENPLFMETKGYNRSFLNHFLGEKTSEELKYDIQGARRLKAFADEGIRIPPEYRKGKAFNDPVELLQNSIYNKIGASKTEIEKALSARDTYESLYDLYKSKLLKKEGIDAIIRKRSSPTQPEVFVTNPYTPKLRPLDLREKIEYPFGIVSTVDELDKTPALQKLLHYLGLANTLTE